MLGHLTGNDPRPHYFHQTNIAQADPNAATDNQTVGGTLYAVMDTLIARYEGMFDRTSVPLVQLTHRQVADTLAQQDAWAATRAAGGVSAWLQDGVVHVANSGAAAVDVPVTGTTAGERVRRPAVRLDHPRAGRRAGARARRPGEGGGARGDRHAEGRRAAHGDRRHVDRDARDRAPAALAALRRHGLHGGRGRDGRRRTT